ncbi:MAG: DUF2007 domain-containing protein [Chloroflexi bacterium]|nr:DUF2007 domain-containing protein [Chloroflexota bacterium]
MDKNELVVVYTTQGTLRAEMAKGRLESVGIPAMVKFESAGRTLGIIVDGLGKAEVLVPREFEEQAREVLKENP